MTQQLELRPVKVVEKRDRPIIFEPYTCIKCNGEEWAHTFTVDPKLQCEVGLCRRHAR